MAASRRYTFLTGWRLALAFVSIYGAVILAGVILLAPSALWPKAAWARNLEKAVELSRLYMLAGLVCLFWLHRRLMGMESGASLRYTGLAVWSDRQVLIAVAALVPVLAAGLVAVYSTGGRICVEPGIKRRVVTYIVDAAFMEELVFRGFLFRNLRRTMPFIRAALISAIAFGIFHLLNGLEITSVSMAPGEILKKVGYPFLFGTVVALLYEKGEHSLWGPMLLHFGVDAINLFWVKPDLARPGMELVARYGKVTGQTLALVVAVLLCIWLLPVLKKRGRAGAGP